MAVNEVDSALDVVMERLLTDTGVGGVSTLTGGRIYRDTFDNPTGPASYPIVTVSWMAAPTLNTADGTHVWQMCTILTKVTDTGNDYRLASEIDRRIIERLEGYGEVVKDGVYVVKLRRTEAPPQPSDFVNGKRYVYYNQLWYTEAEPA